MRLPEDKNERKKVLILIVLGCCVGIYGTVIGVIQPLKHKREVQTEQRLDLEKNLRDSELRVTRMGRDRTENGRLAREIHDLTTDKGYVMLPVHGNYGIRAKPALEALAEQAGVELDSIDEGGITGIPQSPARKTPNAFQSYTLRCRAKVGLFDVIRLIKLIEESNPMVCVSSFGVDANAQTPEAHKVGIDIQAPIWTDLDMPSKIKGQLDRYAQEDAANEATEGSVEQAGNGPEESQEKK
jgi:hypothetical protein